MSGVVLLSVRWLIAWAGATAAMSEWSPCRSVGSSLGLRTLLEEDPFGLDDAGTVGAEHDEPDRARGEFFEDEPAKAIGRRRVHGIGSDELDGRLRGRDELADEATGAVLDHHHLDLDARRSERDLAIGVLGPHAGELVCRVEHQLGEFGVDRAPCERGPGSLQDVFGNGLVRSRGPARATR